MLHDVNFTLRQGETLAVVGINGAGKSTLVKLLLRFYDPTDGKILYNGKPLPEYDLEQLRLPLAPCSRIIKTLPCPSTRM